MSLKKTIFAASLLLLTFPSYALADKAIIVMDASGSMWGQMDNKPKIGIAQEVIDDLLKDWPSNTELGLIAYGHREKANCGDIQTLVPVGPVNASQIKAAVDDINPKGKTPLTDAVRLAAKELRSEEGKATVILVSDGLETCEADPCAVATELEKAGVDFTVHVVGFGTSNEENRQLQCLADNTGGRMLSAGNASELKTAMVKTVELVKKPEPPKQTVVKVQAARIGTLTLASAKTKQRVYGMDGKEYTSLYLEPGHSMELPAGQYKLVDGVNNFISVKQFDVKSGDTTIIDMSQYVGTVTLANAKTKQRVYGMDGKEFTSLYLEPGRSMELPIGEYKLVDGVNNFISVKQFDVKSGDTTIIDMSQYVGTVTLANAKTKQRVYGMDGKEYTSLYLEPGRSMELPVGQYKLVDGVNNFVSVEQVQIKAGEETVLDFGG